MAIPGLFVEYLITGALALIWLYPVLTKAGLVTISASYLPLLALGLYVIGMVIDFFAWAITLYIQSGLRAWAEKGYGFKFQQLLQILKGRGGDTRSSTSVRQIKFAIYAPEVAKEAAMRSSRDRIARSAIINSILLTIFTLHNHRWAGIILILVTILMWVFFELASFSYELKAEKVVDEKIWRDRDKASRA